MALDENTTPLLAHTLGTLCDELVSGRGVALQRGDRTIRLASATARAVFNWYRCNRPKWGGLNREEDVEAIAREVNNEPPVMPALKTRDTAKPPEIVYLKKIRAHRFAGIHRYGSVNQPPPFFECVLENGGPRVWIIEGSNAADKTSLLSAICWCLTGHVYRSQRKPETTKEPIALYAGKTVEDTDEEPAGFDISAVTPVPSSVVLEGLCGEKVLLDTWVELTFVDAHGSELGTMRRSVKRARRGNQIEISEPDFSALGVPPIALEIGTRMTGLLPYIQVGHRSDLSSAVAELTGLRPLKDLVRHATKSRDKLRGTLPKARIEEISRLDEEYVSECDELAQILDKHKGIAPMQQLPRVPEVSTCEEEIAKLKSHFENRQAVTLAGAKAVLGDSFDSGDQDSCEDLIKSIPLAHAAVAFDAIAKLQSAARLHALGCLTEADLTAAEATIEMVLEQAKEIANLERKKDIAARMRLYARIADWLKDTNLLADDVTTCPVCGTPLAEKEDSVTHKLVVEHIREFLHTDKGHLQYAVTQWARNSADKLSRQLAKTLSSELGTTLPGRPSALISDAFCKDLLASPAFSKTLAPLKATVTALCERYSTAEDTFVEPPVVTFPASIAPACQELADAMSRIRRAIAFARWRHANADFCRRMIVGVLGTDAATAGSPGPGDVAPRQVPLVVHLRALERIVTESEPLQMALARTKNMTGWLATRRSLQFRIERYGRTAQALEQLFEIGQVVDDQVGSLMQTLSTDTSRWRNNLYSPAYSDAPSIAEADVADDGSLILHAEAGGTRVPAQHICNSSDLRATLLAFLLAFWKHLATTQGAISLLLLDDLQELFDPHNRRRIACAIPKIAQMGAQVLLTTNDHDFGRNACRSAYQAIGREHTLHQQAVPASAGSLRMTLRPFRETIQRKRENFERKENDHEAARDYLNELRIYLDARLLEFFGVADPAMPAQPTFADLVNAVRRRVSQGMEPFSGRVFGQLASEPALRDGSEFVRLLNESHHSRAHLITYPDVARIADDCKRVLDLVHLAAEEYERWLRRDPREPLPATPASLPAGRNLSFTVPLFLATAAADRDSPMYDVVEAEEPFACNWLENHAIYVNNTDNLGFAGSKSCRLVVNLNGNVPGDNSLVVALHGEKVYVRRLLHVPQDAATVVLAAENLESFASPPNTPGS